MPYASKEDQREYQRKWIRARREAFFQDKSCVMCGSTRNLELDHIDPTEKESHSIWSWSKKRRDAEIAKCQVLCARCHRIKTNEDYNRQPAVLVKCTYCYTMFTRSGGDIRHTLKQGKRLACSKSCAAKLGHKGGPYASNGGEAGGG